MNGDINISGEDLEELHSFGCSQDEKPSGTKSYIGGHASWQTSHVALHIVNGGHTKKVSAPICHYSQNLYAVHKPHD